MTHIGQHCQPHIGYRLGSKNAVTYCPNMGNGLKALRESRGWTQDKAAERLNMSKSGYVKLERGDRKLTEKHIVSMARTYDVDPLVVINGPVESDNVIEADFASGQSGNRRPIFEIDVHAGAGGGGLTSSDVTRINKDGHSIGGDVIKDEWHIPDSYIREQLHVAPSKAWIVEVAGDSGFNPDNSNAPGSLYPGDRIIVDTSDTLPSPPGAFLVHDGTALVVKWITVVPRSNPQKIRLTSRNPAYPDYEATLDDEARIIGRVRGRITAM